MHEYYKLGIYLLKQGEIDRIKILYERIKKDH
jgi:hypothetical protein